MKRTEVRLPDDVYTRIAELAKRERRSLNQQVIVLLEAALLEQAMGEMMSRKDGEAKA